ncbi:60S ribosomal protein L10 [Sciurus carolinensis]|uniref:60S ribosomal protein L10 n=1 Tax=Sciurus carolinensis TaxID=30640 RepID=A0AA41T958_SCICA|nr:60S ribosomal protein L10 [Sciurus carolinensis]
MAFIFQCGSILSMSSVSARCCPELGLTGSRQSRVAFGKPQGTVARIHIGQVITSIHTKLQKKEHVIDSYGKGNFKFPGCQKVCIPKKWGFTKFNTDEFQDMMNEKQVIPDGSFLIGAKNIPNHGPLDK